MSKFLVIGNPIEHSLSPSIHNYWFKKYNFANHFYEKKKVNTEDLGKIVDALRKNELKGVFMDYKNSIWFKIERFFDRHNHLMEFIRTLIALLVLFLQFYILTRL